MRKYVKHQASLVRKCKFKCNKRAKELEKAELAAKERASTPGEIFSSEFGEESDMSIAA